MEQLAEKMTRQKGHEDQTEKQERRQEREGSRHGAGGHIRHPSLSSDNVKAMKLSSKGFILGQTILLNNSTARAVILYRY